MKRYSPRQIERTLSRYQTVEVSVEVGQRLCLGMLETADAYALLDRLIEQEGAGRARSIRFPYWAEIWPAAIGLARWLCSSSRVQTGPGVVRELGCGVGLVGIALARLGCRVEATDFVEDALVFTSHNARRNGVTESHRVAYLDWSHPVGDPCACLVGSDIAYERTLHPCLSRTVRALLRPGGRLIVSDPGRPAAQPFFAALCDGGFEHERDTVEVRWRSLAHRVDVHTFVRPP